MSNRVFEDRLGMWVVNLPELAARLPGIKRLEVVDVFLSRAAAAGDLARVRAAGLKAHLWAARDGLSVPDYVARTLADIERLGPSACELNIELPADAPLPSYLRQVVAGLRAVRPHYRFRLNVGCWKAFGLPTELLATDAALFACEQTYLGDMSRMSEADVYADLLAYCPARKATLCYGAAGPVPPAGVRVCTLPDLTRTFRGVIFHDDLAADAGLL